MERIKDDFLDLLERHVPLGNQVVAEIGSGTGARSVKIAERSLTFIGIEPTRGYVNRARRRKIPNASFEVGSGEAIPLPDGSVGVTIFALSLHHVPVELMPTAIDEGLRITDKSGYVVFLEPAEEGSFFEAEIHFDACDGDEREVKRAAREAILSHPGLEIIAILDDETVFKVRSLFSFAFGMDVKKNLEELEGFLERNQWTLNAWRKIYICKPRRPVPAEG